MMQTLLYYNNVMAGKYNKKNMDMNGRWRTLDVSCPECGKKIKECVSTMFFLSFPPKRKAVCTVCKWEGYTVI